MLSKGKIVRTNELTNKAKMEELSAKGKIEQQESYEGYLEAFRGGMRHHIEGMKVTDQEGTDVTPEKLKKIQREEGLHSRKWLFSLSK